MSLTTPARSIESGQAYQNFIGGEWKPARKGETFVSTNPARVSDVIGQYQKSGAADLEEAVEAAVKAQRGWEAIPAPGRGEILYRVAQILERRSEEFAQLMTREMGKILKETRGDVQVAIDVAKFMAGEGRRAEGETIPSA
ncbi:MAG: aldehyde dehydrogenase family protein, partial [Ktedonobacteraceae bacterium]